MGAALKFIRKNAAVFCVSAAVIAAYALIFGRYLPNASGGFGHDYEQQFPNLLAGYYWHLQNGFFSIPWFIPSQCGGVPLYADPGHGLFSLPQFLTIFANPIIAIQITFYVFALLGYAGFYLLLRRRFWVSRPLSMLGATLFLFNGFYAYRMIIGHPFHAFMLWPFLALAVIPPRAQAFGARSVSAGLLAGGIFAYMFHSAMIHVLPAAGLALLVAMLFHAWQFGGRREAWGRLAIALGAALGLIASKLIASASFLSNFPRNGYPLPGFPSMFQQIRLLAEMLFFRVRVQDMARYMANSRWTIGQQETEFGVSFVPLLLLALAGALVLAAVWKRRGGISGIFALRPSRRTPAYLLSIAAMLAVPLAMNWYAPGWNAVLKSIPGIKSASLLTRWYAAYVPLAILAGVFAADRVPLLGRRAGWIAAAGIAAVVAVRALEDRSIYAAQRYDGAIIAEGYRRASSSSSVPAVYGISMYDPEVKPDPTRGQNDLLVAGLSQLACYNAIFGYRLEWLPLGDLHTGPALDETSGHYNIKNPACYLYPKENGCAPGDHFLLGQSGGLETFLRYKPYPFKKSAWQRAADMASILSLLVFASWFAFIGARIIWRKFSR